MMKVIVVEDDTTVQEQIKKILRMVAVKNEVELEVTYFKKYNTSLKEEIENTLYPKIYIMDIELENSISGIEIAEEIRENDWDSEIIFVTCHDKMFETVHRRVLEVFDFIEKFEDMEERMSKDIQLILNRKEDKKILKLEAKHAVLELYMKNILYIVRDKEERKSVIHTKENVEFRVPYSLIDLKEKLDDRFVQTHKSCIANKNHMTQRNYAKGYFMLDSGEQVDYLSKKYKKEIEG